MKVYYPENPMKIRYEFHSIEKKLFETKVKSHVQADYQADIWYLIYQGKIEEAKDKCDPEAFEEAVEEEMQRLLGYFLKELEQGYEHCGDCIKVSCSCAKCWAESFIEGWEWSIDSYIGHYIDQAFRDQRTLNQAIQWLESYNVEPREDGYHIRWMECAKDAAIWLKEYKDEWNLEGNGRSEQGAYYEMNEDKYELVDWL